MQVSLSLLAALLPLAVAVVTKLQPGYSPNGGLLAARDGCTRHSTCAECYGDGYVGGPGKTGHAGVPDPLPTDFEFPTQTGYGPGAVVTCSASNELHNDGFDCCKRYNATWSFCPKSAGCYLPSQQTCCTDGSVCEGEECCGLVDAKATTPFPSGAQQTSPAGDAGTSGAMTTAGTSGDGGATGTDVSTSTPTGAAVMNAIGGAMVVAMGVLGVAML
ncbi:hypothetical protein V494_03094 [Pseudogymnoascus sp. VKM F-4513 (FW-928)]|nr:hypothetical protein V494_03094 [Pseudogymnoascus sp. VKM F-4513 (FW-928)]